MGSSTYDEDICEDEEDDEDDREGSGDEEEDDEDEISYDPPRKLTADDVTGLDQLRSLGQVNDLLQDIEENIDLIHHREYTRQRGERLQNLERAHRAPRCQHVRLNGKPCGSPAVGGQQYCHFHGTAKASGLEFPVIEDGRSFQVAVMRLCQQIANGSIEPANAKVMLQALSLALENIRNSTSLGEQREDYPRQVV